MAWQEKSFEWRRIPGSKTWHFFIRHQSLCGKAKSNGEFEFLDEAPKEEHQICKSCAKTLEKIKERFKKV